MKKRFIPFLSTIIVLLFFSGCRNQTIVKDFKKCSFSNTKTIGRAVADYIGIRHWKIDSDNGNHYTIRCEGYAYINNKMDRLGFVFVYNQKNYQLTGIEINRAVYDINLQLFAECLASNNQYIDKDLIITPYYDKPNGPIIHFFNWFKKTFIRNLIIVAIALAVIVTVIGIVVCTLCG